MTFCAMVISGLAFWFIWHAEMYKEPDTWSVGSLVKCMCTEVSVNMYYFLLLLCVMYPARTWLLGTVFVSASLVSELYDIINLPSPSIRESDACVLVCFSMHVFSAALLAVIALSLLFVYA